MVLLVLAVSAAATGINSAQEVPHTTVDETVKDPAEAELAVKAPPPANSYSFYDRSVNMVDASLRWGSLLLRPGSQYSVSYSDNIFGGSKVASGVRREDIIHRFSLDLQAALDPSVNSRLSLPVIAYAPELVLLHHNSDRNSLNHSGRVQASVQLPRTTFALDHASSDREDIFAESARRERQQLHTTFLRISYDFSEKTQIESQISQQLSQYSTSLGVREWRDDMWVNYNVREKLQVAVGAAGGYADVDVGSNSYINAEQLRVIYTPREKLRFEARGGAEWRMYSGTSGRTVFGPTAGVTAAYRPTPTTIISLIGERQARPSNFVADQLTTASVVSFALDQRIRERYFANVNIGCGHMDYEQANNTAAALNSYDFYSAQFQIGYDPGKRWRAFMFYRHLTRSAGTGLDSFDSNEIGFTASYHF